MAKKTLVSRIVQSLATLLWGKKTRRARRKSIKRRKSSRPSRPSGKKAPSSPRAKSARKRSSGSVKKKTPSSTNRRKPASSKRKTAVKRPPRKSVKQPAKAVADKISEHRIGMVTHYFSRIHVVVVKLDAGSIKVKDRIRIAGKKTDFVQTVDSLQIESVSVSSARKGQLVGLQVKKEAAVGDRVFRLK